MCMKHASCGLQNQEGSHPQRDSLATCLGGNKCCAGCKPDTTLEVNQVKAPTRSLISRIAPTSGKPLLKKHCKLCNNMGHPTDKCTHFEKRCRNCNNFGHEDITCHFEKITHKCKSRGNSSSGRGGRRKPYLRGKPNKSEETTHIEEVEEEVIFQSTEHNEMPVDAGQYDTFDSDDVVITYKNGETLIYYDCLADSATTSHVSNCCEAFTTFKPTNTQVGGVSGIQTRAKGRGTVELESTCNGQKYSLTLKDVLYIPGNKNNLISLGRWEAAGGEYTTHNGKLMLTAKSRSHVAQGPHIANNLYNLRFTLRRPMQNRTSDHAFATQETPSWEAWHKRYGHISYTGLQRMYK